MFFGTGGPMTLPWELSDVTGSQKSKMAATKPGVAHISACCLDSNEISTATPMFSRTVSLMTLLRKLSDVTGSQKSKMVATKPELTYISACRQDSNEIPTAAPMFSKMGIPMVLLCILSVTTGGQKSKMAAPKQLQRMTPFKRHNFGLLTFGCD